MAKKKLTCFTKPRKDGTNYTTCLEGQKGADKKKVKKIKPKIIVVKQQKPKLEIEKRTGKTREEINKADPLSIIAKLPSELQDKITGDMKGKAEMKPLFESLKDMKGYKKREVDKEIKEIFKKHNKDPNKNFSPIMKRLHDDIDKYLAKTTKYNMKPLLKELNKYFRDKIKKLTPQELDARKKRKAKSERDRDAYNQTNFIQDVAEDIDILNDLTFEGDYDRNLYVAVYGYGSASEETEERRMDKVYKVSQQRYKRLIKDYWKQNNKKYKNLEDIVDALKKDIKAGKEDLDDYIRKSDF